MSRHARTARRLVCRCCLGNHLSYLLFRLASWIDETVCEAICNAAESLAAWGTRGCR